MTKLSGIDVPKHMNASHTDEYDLNAPIKSAAHAASIVNSIKFMGKNLECGITPNNDLDIRISVLVNAGPKGFPTYDHRQNHSRTSTETTLLTGNHGQLIFSNRIAWRGDTIGMLMSRVYGSMLFSIEHELREQFTYGPDDKHIYNPHPDIDPQNKGLLDTMFYRDDQ